MVSADSALMADSRCGERGRLSCCIGNEFGLGRTGHLVLSKQRVGVERQLALRLALLSLHLSLTNTLETVSLLEVQGTDWTLFELTVTTLWPYLPPLGKPVVVRSRGNEVSSWRLCHIDGDIIRLRMILASTDRQRR